jgi:ABC-2 type transport system ATP-binding protein
MFADDLVVVGAGRLLAAEPLESTLARGGSTVVVRTPHAATLAALLAQHDITVEPAADVSGDRLRLHGATTATVSEIAFDHRIHLTEITETARSLEEILIDMTGASAEFAAA